MKMKQGCDFRYRVGLSLSSATYRVLPYSGSTLLIALILSGFLQWVA